MCVCVCPCVYACYCHLVHTVLYAKVYTFVQSTTSSCCEAAEERASLWNQSRMTSHPSPAAQSLWGLSPTCGDSTTTGWWSRYASAFLTVLVHLAVLCYVRLWCFDPKVFVKCLQAAHLVSSWQRPLGRNVLLLNIIDSCVLLVKWNFSIGINTTTWASKASLVTSVYLVRTLSTVPHTLYMCTCIGGRCRERGVISNHLWSGRMPHQVCQHMLRRDLWAEVGLLSCVLLHSQYCTYCTYIHVHSFCSCSSPYVCTVYTTHCTCVC